MKKGLSKSTLNPEKPVRRNRKYDEEFKQQALAMIRNGQRLRSVAQTLGISENVLHRRMLVEYGDTRTSLKRSRTRLTRITSSF